MKNKSVNIIFLLAILMTINSCFNFDSKNQSVVKIQNISNPRTVITSPGAERLSVYMPELKDKKIALVINQTSRVSGQLLLDTLRELGMNVKKVFAPEHGFRGNIEAGGNVSDYVDPTTKTPVVSLYGNKTSPTAEDLKDIDIVIFDIQDVGVRFYTYISTLGGIIKSCAENNKKLLILDRPNPNGFYIDGPVMENEYKSFVAQYPIPVVYGMTIGELGNMINSEHWMTDKTCNLQVIRCTGYNHKSYYNLPIHPSPNLRNDLAIMLYPTLCFFEGTALSVGRGTDKPFMVTGSPALMGEYSFTFTPKSVPEALHPPFENQICYGKDYSTMVLENYRNNAKIELSWIKEFYEKSKDKNNFFIKNNWFDKLAGTGKLRKQISDGKSENEIRQSWQSEIEKFKAKRQKYLLYEDF